MSAALLLLEPNKSINQLHSVKKTHNSRPARSLESTCPIKHTHATDWKDIDALRCHLYSLKNVHQSFCQAVNPSTQSQYYAVLNHLLKQSVSSASRMKRTSFEENSACRDRCMCAHIYIAIYVYTCIKTYIYETIQLKLTIYTATQGVTFKDKIITHLKNS